MKETLTTLIESAKRFRKPLIALAVVLALVIPLLPRNPFYQDLIIMIFFWATLATAWNLLGGFAGQISLGHAGFFGIGAYTSTILYLTFGLSPWIGMFAGAGLSMIVALLVGFPTFRLTSHFFALATLAFGEVLRLLASYWRELTNGGVGLLLPHTPGFRNFIFDNKAVYAYIILVMLLAVLCVTYIFKKSRFGGLEAVKDLSFMVREGEILGLIGPNGAGKTTVFNLISGFIVPDRGTIVFNGKDISSLKAPHCFCRECIGRTFQLVKPFQHMTVLENVMVGAFACTRHTEEAEKVASAILQRIHLSHHAYTTASNLTIADRKRLELGRALATQPKLLLLDEVMAGLNPKETEDIIGIIRSISRDGITIIMIEHVMKAVMSLSDRIVVINNGIKLVEGLPNEVVKDQRVVDAYLGGAYHATAGLK